MHALLFIPSHQTIEWTPRPVFHSPKWSSSGGRKNESDTSIISWGWVHKYVIFETKQVFPRKTHYFLTYLLAFEFHTLRSIFPLFSDNKICLRPQKGNLFERQFHCRSLIYFHLVISSRLRRGNSHWELGPVNMADEGAIPSPIH